MNERAIVGRFKHGPANFQFRRKLSAYHGPGLGGLNVFQPAEGTQINASSGAVASLFIRATVVVAQVVQAFLQQPVAPAIEAVTAQVDMLGQEAFEAGSGQLFQLGKGLLHQMQVRVGQDGQQGALAEVGTHGLARYTQLGNIAQVGQQVVGFCPLPGFLIPGG